MTTFFALFLTLIALPQARAVVAKPTAGAPATRLEFREFFDPTINELQPSDKLRRLQGQRVRIIGFMAEMEHQPEGYFYLCARPVLCDESGGGIGELPIDAVRVVVRSHKGSPLKFVAPPIEVTGILELGGQSAGEPDSWTVRVLIENVSTGVHSIKPTAQPQRKKSKR